MFRFIRHWGGLVGALIVIIGTGTYLLSAMLSFQPAEPLEHAVVSRPRHKVEAATTQTEADQAEPVTKPEATAAAPAPAEAAPTAVILNCSNDCSLAAVDKTSSLPSGYAPSTVATNLPGGGSLTAPTRDALVTLFADASQKSVKLEIISAFRSYQTQATTFESWVAQEIASGLDRAAAEAKANTYSARPGHSEHQLGTTVDLKCLGCEAFNSDQNKAAYSYLEQNAHRFGFVISYPKGQETLTGYTYEPWHIRWIGKDHAAKLQATGYTAGNGNYLAKYLRSL